MKTFLKKISESYETEIEGQKVKLSLARAKNKFSSKDSDPSRFRNVLLNLELSRDGQSHFVELQVHHKLILDFNDESHAHDYYDFFRRELANQYGKEMEASLNFMLEERMLLFKDWDWHLSFQEALASQALAEQNQLGLEAAERFKRVGGGFAEFLNIPFYRNMLRIGAGRVGDVFGRYWPLTSSLTDDGRAGLWNLLLGAKKLILASFLRPDASTYKSYEKAAFPPGSEDWFFTIFMFGKPKGNGSLMYNLSKIKSQVKNLQAALVTHEACHILFRNQGLDVSAFEVPSIAFPMSWDGHGQALDVSKAPPRIGLQLSFNWKNSLLHFEEMPRDTTPILLEVVEQIAWWMMWMAGALQLQPVCLHKGDPCLHERQPLFLPVQFAEARGHLGEWRCEARPTHGEDWEHPGPPGQGAAKDHFYYRMASSTLEDCCFRGGRGCDDVDLPVAWCRVGDVEIPPTHRHQLRFYHRAAAVEGATEGVESVKVSTRWLAATGGGGNDVMVSTYQSSYELKSSHALSDFVTVPPAGKQRVSEEKYRFHRTEEVIAAAGGHSVGSGFAGGHLEQHYGRVAQVARASRRRQMVATQFLCMRATFLKLGM
eukprot:g22698.t1